jgi:hypothetical protein
MYRKKLKAPTVETCKFRGKVRRENGIEVGTCRLLQALIDGPDQGWCRVRRDACDACCQSFPPSKENVNPVVASLVYTAAARILAAGPAGYDLERISALRETAMAQLNLVRSGEEAPVVPARTLSSPLSQLVPRPAKRHGRRVRRWAVGVTTAPRGQPTLEACLESLIGAGFEKPYLFIDSPVRVPDRFAHLPGTLRDEKIGAWPNYYLGLLELLMREPDADAYLIVQDDVVFFDRENLRQYLEDVLWPGRSTVLVSLYSAAVDTGPEPGWHPRRGGWVSGAHAFLFPPQMAKAFVIDRTVFQHRWLPHPVWSKCLDDLIGNWARDRRVDVWFPTPSLAQHVGDASTLWPNARVVGSRRAEPFAGDL